MGNKQTSNNVGKGFSRIVFFYDALACITSFNQINNSQLAFLSHLSTQSTCLILGGGTGHFLQKLVEENKSIHVTYVDASEKMIDAAKKRIQKETPTAFYRVTFICSDVENFYFDTYDIIVCNYFLDLFDEAYINVLVKQFYQVLNLDGILYITDFTVPNTNTAFGKVMKVGLNVLYTFFKWTTSLSTKKISDIHNNTSKNNFNRIQIKQFLNGVLCCSIYGKKQIE